MSTRITLGGAASIEHDGRKVDHRTKGGGQAWIAFALLVLARERVVSRDELADALWPRELPDTWETAIRNVVSRVRDILSEVGLPAGELLTRSAGGYALHLPAGCDVDVEEAEQLLAAAAEHLVAGRSHEAVRASATAKALLDRPLLAGIDGVWLDRLRDRLHGERVRAAELEGEAQLLVGDTAAAIAAADDAVRAAPFRETAYRLLMRCHVAAGNRAEALRAYERCRRMLAEELGVDPSPETEATYLSLLGEATAAELDPVVAAPPVGAASTTRTPVLELDDGGLLIGRADDLDRVAVALETSRLVTLIGVAGVGKSRLARSAAARVAELEPRTYFIELALVDDDGVVHAVAFSVGGEQAGADPTGALVAQLAAAPALLVLDNCEHVLGPVTELVGRLLRECGELQVLATSRVALAIDGEQVVAVAPLPTPADDAEIDVIEASPAVEMFLVRALAASSDFALTPANAPAIAEVCRRLDGIPLALELAAARVRSMPPEEIAGYLGDRFRLLRRAPRDESGRHRSLEDAVSWSYDLLSDDERAAFDALAVFAGSFNLDAARAVIRRDLLDVLELVESLAERSMVLVVEDDREARYRLLETMREFGRRQLDRSAAAADATTRHIAHHLGVAEAAALGLQGAEEGRWVRTMHADFANLRAAFATATAAGDVDTCLRLVVALFDYAFFRMQREVGEWASLAVAMPGAELHRLYGEAAAVAGYLAWERGEIDAAIALTAAALSEGGGWVAEDSLGTIELFRGHIDEAMAAYERAVAVATDAGNDYRRSLALGQLAFTHVLAGASDATELAAAALSAAELSGNPTATCNATWAMGVSMYDSDPPAALDEMELALELARSVDNRMSYGAASVPAEELRAKLTSRSSANDLAATVERLDYWLNAGAPPILWSTVRRIARLLAANGSCEAAALALGAEAHASLKLPVRQRERRRHEPVVEHVRSVLGDEAYERLFAHGATLSPDALVADLRAAAGGQP